MKKINSITYGGKVIGISALFLIPLPLALFLINTLFKSDFLRFLIAIFILIGLLIEIAFFIHLSIELWQDKKLEQYYDSHRNIKLYHAPNQYECGNCGNTYVKSRDTVCSVCGVHFQNMNSH